jgi:Hint domain
MRGRVRVEKLRLGDEVITFGRGPLPIRWIGQRIGKGALSHG